MPYIKQKGKRHRLLEMAQVERTHAATLRRLRYHPDSIDLHIKRALQLEEEARNTPAQGSFTIPWSD